MPKLSTLQSSPQGLELGGALFYCGGIRSCRVGVLLDCFLQRVGPWAVLGLYSYCLSNIYCYRVLLYCIGLSRGGATCLGRPHVPSGGRGGAPAPSSHFNAVLVSSNPGAMLWGEAKRSSRSFSEASTFPKTKVSKNTGLGGAWKVSREG